MCRQCVRRSRSIARALDAKGLGMVAQNAAGSLWAYHAVLAGVRSRPITYARRCLIRAVYARMVSMGASRAEVAALLRTTWDTVQAALDEVP